MCIGSRIHSLNLVDPAQIVVKELERAVEMLERLETAAFLMSAVSSRAHGGDGTTPEKCTLRDTVSNAMGEVCALRGSTRGASKITSASPGITTITSDKPCYPDPAVATKLHSRMVRSGHGTK